MVTPISKAASVATTPISSDTRAPWKMPAATSRPSESEPRGNALFSPGHRNGRATMLHESPG